MTSMDSTDALVAKPYIEKVIAGDEEAFTWLYKNYSKKVYYFASQFFKSENLAEDIVQEVFIQVHKKIHTLQSANAFNSWLYTITYHTCVNHKRGKIILTQFENEKDEELIIEATNEDISKHLENQRIQAIIIETLESMKLPLRIVGQLKFLEDMKNVEIAEILNIQKATVSKRIKTIKKILQKSLEKNGVTYSSYGMVLVSPAMLHEVYQMLLDSHAIGEVASNHVLHNVLYGTVKEVGKRSLSYVTRYVIGSAFVLCSGFVFLQVNQKESTMPIKLPTIEMPPIVEETAKIVDIQHSTQGQQTAVQLNIETSNDNYDTITIDDKKTLKVSNNGTYVVKLIKEGKVMDQREVTISNIDRNSPKAYSEKDNRYYYFYLADEESGVNGNSIQYIKNGEYSTEYTYLENEKLLRIANDGVSTHEVYVSDYAGNIFEITIG